MMIFKTNNPSMTSDAAGASPYAAAQRSLRSGARTLTVARYAMVGVGAVLVVWSLVSLFLSGPGSAVVTAISGVSLIYVGIFQLPKFMEMLSMGTSMVDDLATKSELGKTGMPGRARITRITQTGRMVNFNPEVTATLEVEHPGTGAAYPVETTFVVPQLSLARVQPGCAVDVRVDPVDPTQVAVVV